MKKIGDIPFETDKEGNAIDPGYCGGVIVKLSPQEAKSIELLQQAIDGEVYKWSPSLPNNNSLFPNIKNQELDDIFKIIQSFTEARFYVNEFQRAADTMDTYLMALGGRPEGIVKNPKEVTIKDIISEFNRYKRGKKNE